jgi:acyl-CoA reductase-like NAD-dependent aldehyde dehydrogenase
VNDRANKKGVIEVRNPYNGHVVGSVPKATVAEIRKAIEAGHAYKSKLTRHERATILQRAAGLLRERSAQASELITRESGLSKKDSTYEVGRVGDVLNFSAAETLRDDGQSFACDITPNGRNRRVYTRREPLAGIITAITPSTTR